MVYPAGVADVLFSLSEVSMRQGDYHQAIGYLRQTLTLHRRTGEQHGETLALRSLALALHRVGQAAAARAELTMAFRLAAKTGNTYQQAAAHGDLADSYYSAGEHGHARHHWQRALDLYTELGASEADEVRAQLAAVSPC